MAIEAGNVYVCTIECEIGLGIVIKRPQVPGDRIVARPTVVLVYLVVRIVFQVTCNTVTICAGENLAVVTGFTLDILVFAEPREIGQVMVE